MSKRTLLASPRSKVRGMLRVLMVHGVLVVVTIACGSAQKPKGAPVGIDSPTSEEEAAGIGSAAAPNQTGVVVTDEAIVRDIPNPSGKVLARIGKGSKVNVLATAGAWIKVAYGESGETGWTFHSSIGTDR